MNPGGGIQLCDLADMHLKSGRMVALEDWKPDIEKAKTHQAALAMKLMQMFCFALGKERLSPSMALAYRCLRFAKDSFYNTAKLSVFPSFAIVSE